MNTVAKINQLASVREATVHCMWQYGSWNVFFEINVKTEKIELKALGHNNLSEAVDEVFNRVVELGHMGLTSLHIPLLEGSSE